MAADTVRDKYEKIGVPDNNADLYSPTPIGAAPPPPPETERLVYYPMGGGVPAA